MAKKKAEPKQPARARRNYVSKLEQKAARELRIAAAVATGTPVAAIARAEGLSRPHASVLANSTPVKHIVTDLVNAHLPEVESLFALGLLCIREALENGNSYAVEKIKDPEGNVTAKPVLIGPDHYARMGAMKVLNTIICAGRAQPKPIDPKDLVPKITFPELLRIRAQQDEYERQQRELVAAPVEAA
jgi:hypothetical protein